MESQIPSPWNLRTGKMAGRNGTIYAKLFKDSGMLASVQLWMAICSSLFLLKITAGKKKKKKQTSQEDKSEEKSCKETYDLDIRTGNFAATRLTKHEDKISQRGKIVKMEDMNVTVEWWIGRYSCQNQVCI